MLFGIMSFVDLNYQYNRFCIAIWPGFAGVFPGECIQMLEFRVRTPFHDAAAQLCLAVGVAQIGYRNRHAWITSRVPALN